MSKRAFDKIMQGIEQARTYLDGTADKRRYRVHVPEKVDVKSVAFHNQYDMKVAGHLFTPKGMTADANMAAIVVGHPMGAVKEQSADLYVHVSDKSSLWDACGPEAILKAAGGCFVHVDGSQIEYRATEMANKKGIHFLQIVKDPMPEPALAGAPSLR